MRLLLISFLLLALSVHSAHCFADDKPKLLTIATWNLEWFFDNHTGDNFSELATKLSAPTPQDWEWKLSHVASVIAEMQPTIIALQEVENRHVLLELKKQLESQHQLKYRIAFSEGYDLYTEQDVAILYQSGLVELSWREQSYEMFKSGKFYNLNKHLFAKFEWGEGDEKESLLVFCAHLRATPEAAEIRQKQARLARSWCEGAIQAHQNLVMLGDWNTEEEIGKVTPGSELDLLMDASHSDPFQVLTDLSTFLPEGSRSTHISNRCFDRILVSKSVVDDEPNKTDIVFRSIYNRKELVVRGTQPEPDHRETYYGIPAAERDISDHYPLIGIFDFK